MAWRVELHVHTTVSDGSMTPHQVLRLAARKGLAAVAVTDHDTFRGSALAARAARVLGVGVTVVPAAEVRTREGDVLVYCPDEPEGDPRPRGPVEELWEWAVERACILVPAHPYHPVRSSVGGRVLWSKARLWSAVEAWNPRGPPPLNLLAWRAARRLGLPATSGSDAHVPLELGVAAAVVYEEPSSPEAVVEAVARGRLAPTPGVPGLGALVQAASWGLARRLGVMLEETLLY